MRLGSAKAGAAVGFAVAGVATAGWGLFLALTEGLNPSLRPSENAVAIVAVVWSLAFWLTGLGARVSLAGLAAGGLVAAGWLSYLGGLRSYGTIREGLIWFGAAAFALTLAAVCHLAARWEASDAPVRSGAFAALRRPAWWIGALSGALAVVLVGQFLVLHANPLRVQLAEEVAEVPAMPSEVVGEVAWSTSIPGIPRDYGAGVRGPVIAVTDGVVGVDPADGSIAWQRRREGASLCEWGNASGKDPVVLDTYLLISPNRRYVAYTNCRSDWARSFEVVDTMTGALVLHGTIDDRAIGQLTDEVLWIEDRGVRLADGEVLWEALAATSLRTVPSHFVDVSECYDAAHVDICRVETLAQNDSKTSAAYEGIVLGTSARNWSVDGWVAQLMPGADPPSQGSNSGMRALNLVTGETVPLGEFNHVSSISPTQLILQRLDDSRVAFDPVTRQVTELDTQKDAFGSLDDWPLPNVSSPGWDRGEYSRYSRKMTVLVDGQEVAIELALPAGISDYGVGPAGLSVWSAPGCVIVQGSSGGHVDAGVNNDSRVYLSCLR